MFNEDYVRYYDYNSYRIRQEIITGRINSLRQHGYSTQFVDILSSMLELDENKRPAINQLFNVFNRAKKTCNYEPILRGSVNMQGANYHQQANVNMKKDLSETTNNTSMSYQPKRNDFIESSPIRRPINFDNNYSNSTMNYNNQYNAQPQKSYSHSSTGGYHMKQQSYGSQQAQSYGGQPLYGGLVKDYNNSSYQSKVEQNVLNLKSRQQQQGYSNGSVGGGNNVLNRKVF